MRHHPQSLRWLHDVLRALVWILATSPLAAHAQSSTGSIEGNVFDQVGTPLSGVRITAASATQIGGEKTTYTAADGSFRFGGLFPGDFEVRASAPKMKTVVQPSVKVGLSGAAAVDLIMEVETAEEQVVIVSKAPVINTKSAKVKEIIDGEFMEGLPGPNRNWTDILQYTAGVEGMNVRGAGGNRSAANLDGFNTVNPYDGSYNQLVSIYSMAATEITTAGAGAAFGSTTGGVADMVTRSGSNRFELDSELRYREPRTVEFFKEPGEDDRDEYWLQGLVNFGGPIIRDRLWYYLSFEGLFITRYPLNPSTANNGGRKPDNSPPNRYQRPNFLQKITYQVTPRNKVEVLAITTPERSRYTDWPNYNRDPEADSYLHRVRMLVGATWQTLLTDNMFNRLQVGYQMTYNEGGPMKCIMGNADTCEAAPKIVNNSFGGYWFSNSDVGRWNEAVGGYQLKNSTEYFIETKSLGTHALTLGIDVQLNSRSIEERRTGNGQEFQVQNGPSGVVPFKRTEYCPTDLETVTGECLPGTLARKVTGTKADVFLQDGWRATKFVTATGGVGYHKAAFQNSDGVDVMNNHAFTPHFALSWDATHDGRTVLRTSYNQYADLGGLSLADYVSRGWSTRTCEWDPAAAGGVGAYNKNCAFSNGRPSAGRRIGANLKIPRTHEMTLGAEREILQGVALGADFVYKAFLKQYDDFEINRIWNAGGTELDPNGGYRNGREQTIMEVRTQDNAKRRYLGATVQLQKREGALKATAAYTWSQLRGTQPVGGYTTAWGNNPAQDIFYTNAGFLAGDRKHALIVKGVYQITDWLQFGAIYTFRTGTPYNQMFYNSRNNGFTDLRAQQGQSAGANPNDPGDDRPLRLPDLTTFDLQARARLKRFIGVNLDVFCDYQNILSLRGITGVATNDGPNFGVPTAKQSAAYLQAGLRYVY